MKVSGCILLCLLIRLSAALWPLPTTLQVGGAERKISRYFKIYREYAEGVNAVDNPHRDVLVDRLDFAIDRTMLGLERLRHAETYSDNFLVFNTYPELFVDSMTISIRGLESSFTEQSALEEAYELHIEDGRIILSVWSTTGIIRGLTTFLQLVTKGEDRHLRIPAAFVIIDEPYFQHRGLNLDLSRHYISIESIERTIRGMEMNKMNRLHLHFTDSQSWPLIVPKLPLLSALGAYHPNSIYSIEDVKHLQQYAFDRGVVIIPEIDTPGHTAIVGKSFPKLLVHGADSLKEWPRYCVQPPCGQLKLKDKYVEQFVSTILSSVGSSMRKFSNYFHTGGDEISETIYELQFGKNSRATISHELQSFLSHESGILQKMGYKHVVWEDIILEWNCSLPRDNAIVQTWKSEESITRLLELGYKVIGGIADYCYLDCGFGQWLTFDQEGRQTFSPYADWCSPVKNWMQMYSYDPVKDLHPDSAKNLLGFEVHLWTEKTDDTNLDFKLWPRAAAAAEVMWTGPQSYRPQDLPQAAIRLSYQRVWMQLNNIQVEPIHMEWCDLNPGACVLHTAQKHPSNASSSEAFF